MPYIQACDFFVFENLRRSLCERVLFQCNGFVVQSFSYLLLCNVLTLLCLVLWLQSHFHRVFITHSSLVFFLIFYSKDDGESTSNYRSVSPLPNEAKLYGSIFFIRWKDFVVQQKLIKEEQFIPEGHEWLESLHWADSRRFLHADDANLPITGLLWRNLVNRAKGLASQIIEFL